MRSKTVIVSLLVLILLAALIPQVDADIRIHLSLEDEPTIEPIAMGNISTWEYEVPVDMCVTADGTIFTVHLHPYWDIIRRGSLTSFVAWNSDGSVRWAQSYINWERIHFGVTTDESHVFVTGGQRGELYLGKYDFQGNSIWNSTWDTGDTEEYGFDIALTDDGFIMVSGWIRLTDEMFLLCFDSQGELVWEKRFLDSPAISCHSDFVYARFNDTLQKIRSDGTNVWSTAFDSGQYFNAHDDIIYVGSHGGELSQALVMGLSPINGEEIWSANITFTDSNQELYNITQQSHTITADGSLLLMVRLLNRTSYNLLKIDDSGNLLWNQTILNYHWSYPIIRMKEESRLCITGRLNLSTIEITVYDLSSIAEYTYVSTNTSTIFVNPLDIPMIGMTIAGVALFNAGLIIFLKRRYET
ncbi:MAG: PQQ-binding-like beta-propeller repeat protein, partial [Candidatus Thorarchaeota archaeon]|nr:PQQ-binding-like beta-propeller repeat protein [Candidatus Thorarchaeota archaeon]